MFTINKDNIDHIVEIGSYKYDDNKQRVFKELYFNPDGCSRRLKSLLKKIWW